VSLRQAGGVTRDDRHLERHARHLGRRRRLWAAAYTLAPDDATHTHTSDQSGLTQAHSLTPADASHGHTAEPTSLQAAYTLTPADATHGHAADAAGLTQANVLTPGDAQHGHTADTAALTQASTLTPDASAHGHTADASVFTTSPAVPTGLNVVSKTSTSVTVGWDAVTGVDAYDIDRDLAVVATDVTATQYEDTELDPSTEYSYRVRSVVYL